MSRFLRFFISLSLLSVAFGQAVIPEGQDKEGFEKMEPGSQEERARLSCRSEKSPDSEYGPFRSFNGQCTNEARGMPRLWGSTNRAQFSYFNVSSVEPSGQDLPSAREISNVLFESKKDVFDPRGLNEMAVFFAQFVDHTLTATPANVKEILPIEIPENDPRFNLSESSSVISKGQLRFFRSTRVNLTKKGTAERPLNSLTSFVDLDSVYGASKERFTFVTEDPGKGNGLLKTGPRNFLPLNEDEGGEVTNAPPQSGSEYFVAGDHRANEHPVLTSLHTLFMREHNSIAKELKSKLSPTPSGRILYEVARKINIAQMQKIVFKDWYKAITGTDLPPYGGFNKDVDSTISIEFSTAAFRVGHTMIGNHITRLGPKLVKKPPIQFDNMFFRTASSLSGIEDFLRGALNTRSQKVDLKVRDSLRNFLFEGVKGEGDLLDLIALNIQRGRDHALPTYNQMREKFLGNSAKGFSDITSDRNDRSKMANLYGTVNKVEALPGLFAEDLQKGSSMGPTLNEIWRCEFTRLRDGDGFYYEREGQFNEKLREAIPRVRQLFNDSVDTFREIILRNSDVSEGDIPSNIFFVK